MGLRSTVCRRAWRSRTRVPSTVEPQRVAAAGTILDQFAIVVIGWWQVSTFAWIRMICMCSSIGSMIPHTFHLEQKIHQV